MRWLWIISLLCSSALASDTYFAQTSAGSNNGADCADAYAYNDGTHGLGVVGTWTGGATLHLCSTFTFSPGTSTVITAQGSGSVGNVITLKFETGAIITATYWTVAAVDISNRSYITVDGGTNGTIQATANGTGLPNQQDNGIGVKASGCSNCEIKNLTVSNIYVHTCTLPIANCTDTGGQNTYAIYWLGGSHVTVDYNIVHDAKWCLFYGYGPGGTTDTNVLMYNNTISGCDHGGVYGDAAANSILSGSNCSNAVYNNDITMGGNWDANTDPNHHDGWHFWANNAPGAHYYACFYSNYVHGNYGWDGNAGVYIESDEQSVPIFNNVLTATGGGCAVGMIGAATGTGSGGSGLLVANNTVIGFSTSGGTNVCEEDIGIQSTTSATMENNLAAANETYVYAPSASTFTVADYNMYATAAGTNPFYCPSHSGVGFSTWQGTCGYDTHGANTTVTYNTNPYTLSSGSAAIGAATNLTSLGITALDTGAPQTFGAGGSCGTGCIARPGGATAWDAGAYPFQASGQATRFGTGMAIGTGVAFH